MQNIFGFIIHPLELGVIALAVLVGSAGIGIILFTIFVRLLLAPLLITQLRSSRAMQKIQPLVLELRKKHGKDRQALSQATMALYKEHRVNPAMGCLPTLLQFPILIGLFYAFLSLGESVPHLPVACNGAHAATAQSWISHCYRFKSAVSNPPHIYELFHAHFLWLSHGLGHPDPLYILPILAGVTQWIQSRMMLQKSNDPQQKMMNSMMNFMPLMIVFFATRYASGLSLYWVTSTIIAIAIQSRITGWGLLPRPATVLAFLGQGTSSRTLSRGSNNNRKQASAPRTQGTKKIATLNENSAAEGAHVNGAGEEGSSLPLAEAPPPSEVETNGNGAGPKVPKRAVVATRKAGPTGRKANRARGGKGGGRKG